MRPRLFFLFLISIFIFAGCSTPGNGATTAVATILPLPSLTRAETKTPGDACVDSYSRREAAKVLHVADGDSISVSISGVAFRVRYIGIDSPELNRGPYATESAEANRMLVEGKTVWLIRDTSETDSYGRLLRYVFQGEVFVNLELIRQGAARAADIKPDTSCAALFHLAESQAKQAKRGLWGLASAVPTPTASETPSGACPGGCVAPPPGCLIKGNINSKGEKIYHIPGGKNYDRTQIDPEQGERWFCTEEEAIAAGWRKAKS